MDNEDTTEQPDDKTYVDADADLKEFEENSPDPYDILRDDPIAIIPQETATRWDEKRLHSPQHPQSSEPPSPTEGDGVTDPPTVVP